MCYIDGQKDKYSVLNECNRMLKYNILLKVDNSVAVKAKFGAQPIRSSFLTAFSLHRGAGWGTMLQAERSQVQVPMNQRILPFT
jgi:hypothetical protein